MKQQLFVLWVFFLTFFPVIAQDNVLTRLEVISPSNAARLQELIRWETYERGAVAAAFNPDGHTLAIALNDGRVQIQLIDLSTLEVYRTLEGAEIFGTRLQFNLDGTQLLLANDAGAYILWNVTNGERVAFHEGFLKSGFWGASDDLSSYWVFWTDIDRVSVHDLMTGKGRILVPHDGFQPFPALNSEGTLLLTVGESSVVQVLDALSGELQHELEPNWEYMRGDFRQLNGMGFTPDGFVWSGWVQYSPRGNEGGIQFWDVNTGALVEEFEGEDLYEQLYFEPGGHYLAAVGSDVRPGAAIPIMDGSIWIWDRQTRRQVGLRQSTTGSVSLTFNPDGNIYAYTGGTSDVVVLSAVGVDHYRVRLNVSNPLRLIGAGGTLQFSPDGKMLLHVGLDIRVWGVF